MPIHDLSYQHWQGKRHDRPLALVLARAQVRAVLQRRIVRFLLLVSIGFTLAWGGMIYVETHVVRAGPLARIAGIVTVDDQSFRNFLSRQRLVHLLLCLAAADLIALDRRHRALQLYLSRPLRARDYVLAKAIAMAVPLSLATWVPAFLLILVKCILRGDVGWLAAFPWLPASILGYSVALVVPLTLLTLAISSLSRSARSAGATVFGALALSGAIGQAFAALTHHPAWQLLSIHSNLDQVASLMFGNASPLDVPRPAAALVLLAVCGVAVEVLRRRIRAVDVIGGA